MDALNLARQALMPHGMLRLDRVLCGRIELMSSGVAKFLGGILHRCRLGFSARGRHRSLRRGRVVFPAAIISAALGTAALWPAAASADLTDGFHVYNMSSAPIKLVKVNGTFDGTPPIGSVLEPSATHYQDFEGVYHFLTSDLYYVDYDVLNSGARIGDFLADLMISNFNVPSADCRTTVGDCHVDGSEIFFLDRTDHTLLGTPGNNTLRGSSGNDVIRGGGGNDRLYAGSGNDQLYGGPGNDVLIGGPGRDFLDGGPGADTIIDTSGPAVVLTGTDSERRWDYVYVRDGHADDTVICGSRHSIVVADPGDRVLGPCGKVNDTAPIVNGCIIEPYTQCDGVDLHHADLHQAALSYADLVATNLNGATLAGANLAYANLATAKLQVASLAGANLGGANLAYADFPGASFAGANLIGANLAYADFPGASFAGANLAGANLAGAVATNAAYAGAYFCHTTMPDGTVNNVSCSVAPAPPFGGT